MAFAVFFLLALITSSSQGQVLHPHPALPSNEEFLRVNQAVEAAHINHPEIENALVWSLIWHESKYDSLALGSKGEVGLGQLMPATAENMGVKDRTNINANVQATVDLLAHFSQKYKHNVRLMLAAYNSGESKVDKCKCVPPASLPYVNAIDENRHFAQHIIDYVKSDLVPMEVQSASVSEIQQQKQQLSEKLASSGDKKQISKLELKLNRLQSRYRNAQDELDRLHNEALNRANGIADEVNPAADGNAVVSSLNGAIGELEKEGTPGKNDPDAVAAASALDSQVSSLQATLIAHDVLTGSTKQRIADLTARLERLTRLYGVTSDAPRLTGTKDIRKRLPVVAIVAASESAAGLTTDSLLAEALQDTLLRHGMAADAELQTEDFVTHNANALLEGQGKVIHHLKNHIGHKWDYVVIAKIAGAKGENATDDMYSFKATVESRIYTNEGVLLTSRNFSGVGAGFSEQQARDAAAARLAKSVGDYVVVALQPEKQDIEVEKP
jgi:hypothetical protein